MSPKTGRMNWSVKVRLLRMWNVESSIVAGKVNSLELILLDREVTCFAWNFFLWLYGCLLCCFYDWLFAVLFVSFWQGDKIQTSVPLQCIEVFNHILEENRRYVFSDFHVVSNIADMMTTHNSHRLIFHSNTEVIFTDIPAIDKFGLSIHGSEAISKHVFGYSYLVGTLQKILFLDLIWFFSFWMLVNSFCFVVDVIGFLTGVHPEYVDDPFGRLSTVLRFELTDLRLVVLLFFWSFVDLKVEFL